MKTITLTVMLLAAVAPALAEAGYVLFVHDGAEWRAAGEYPDLAGCDGAAKLMHEQTGRAAGCKPAPESTAPPQTIIVEPEKREMWTLKVLTSPGPSGTRGAQVYDTWNGRLFTTRSACERALFDLRGRGVPASCDRAE